MESHWDKQVQIDLLVTEAEGQQDRFLECKWPPSVAIIEEPIQSLSQKANLLKLKQTPSLAVVIPMNEHASLGKYRKTISPELNLARGSYPNEIHTHFLTFLAEVGIIQNQREQGKL